MGGTADGDNLVDICLVDLGVVQKLLDRLKGTMEEILAEPPETSVGE